NALLVSFGQQVPFDAARAEMVKDLVDDAGAVGCNLGESGHVAGIEIADAPGTDLALRLKLLKSLDSFGERDAAAPVQQVEIERIYSQPAQAALAGRNGPCAGCVVRVDLADDVNLIAAPCDGLADHFLRSAFAIHLGGV